MKRKTAPRHYRSEGNEEVLETGLLLQKVKASAAHALFATVCLVLSRGSLLLLSRGLRGHGLAIDPFAHHDSRHPPTLVTVKEWQESGRFPDRICGFRQFRSKGRLLPTVVNNLQRR